MRFPPLLFLGVFLLAQSCVAQTGMTTYQPSHEEALSQVAGLLYLHEMSQKCPFSKNEADTLDIVAMVMASSIPRISQEETVSVFKKVQTRIGNEIATNKEDFCQKAKQNLQTMVGMLQKLQKRSP